MWPGVIATPIDEPLADSLTTTGGSSIDPFAILDSDGHAITDSDGHNIQDSGP